MPAEEASDEDSPAVHNRDVWRGLEEYCRFPHPQGFAVMLTGQWGSGKTHFIDAFLESFVPTPADRDAHKPLRVSLYGVASPDEIGDQLFQQLHPLLAHKATRLFGAVLRSAAKATIKVDVGHAAQLSGALPDADLTSLLGGAKGRIVVFDDFERAAMSPVALLGYINPLVERDECKVIVISDESKITDQDYRDRKEKTVGRTLELRADANAAFAAFMGTIDDPDARSLLEASKDAVLRVFADSGLNNLRLLRQFLWDFERLSKTLTQAQRQHKEAMHELVSLLCASTIELRSGRLTEESFRREDFLHHLRLRSDKLDESSRAAQTTLRRYPTVRFDSALLGTHIVADLVLRSKLPIERTQQQLQRHPYFAKAEQLPSWRALWLSSEVPVQEHDHIVARFEADFRYRTFQKEGEIYHVIGLCLWLSELGFEGWGAAEVEEKVRQYIVDVYRDSTASPDEMRSSTLDYDMGGSFGLAYMNMNDPRFRDLARFHAQQRAEWRQRAYPALAAHLLRLMTEDSEAFLRDVCFTEGGTARLARLGVLKHISAEQFARTISGVRFHDQKRILIALSIRYEQVAAEPELESEVPWLKDVQQHLANLAPSLPRIARSNLTRLSAEFLDKAVIEVDARLRAMRGGGRKPVAAQEQDAG